VPASREPGREPRGDVGKPADLGKRRKLSADRQYPHWQWCPFVSQLPAAPQCAPTERANCCEIAGCGRRARQPPDQSFLFLLRRFLMSLQTITKKHASASSTATMVKPVDMVKTAY